MIADEALGYFSDSQWGRKPILSGLQGTWRAIKQPDIFLVNHQQRGELLRVQLTTSRSDFSGELALKKILRRFLSLFSLLPLSSQPHALTCALSISFTPLSCSLHTHTFPSLLLLLRPLFSPSLQASFLPPSPPLSPLQINVTLWSVATPFLPQCQSRTENRSQVCWGWEPWILILRQ